MHETVGQGFQEKAKALNNFPDAILKYAGPNMQP
jgi:hypothetical protein